MIISDKSKGRSKAGFTAWGSPRHTAGNAQLLLLPRWLLLLLPLLLLVLVLCYCGCAAAAAAAILLLLLCCCYCCTACETVSHRIAMFDCN